MIERVPGVGPASFPSDNVAPLAKALRTEAQSFAALLRSSNTDLANLAQTITKLSDLSQEAEKC
jgi:hypothetical protein